MWGFEQTPWMVEAALPDVRRYDIDDAGGNVIIPDGNAVLWRYMGIAKLLALVEKRSLFFSSIRKLGDPFEGQWSDRTFEIIHERDELWVHEEAGRAVIRDRTTGECETFPMRDGESADKAITRWTRMLRARRPATFVNCWYRGDEESEAMWRLFAGERYGVAVRTTAAALVGSFTERLPDYLGCVEYLDYRKQAMAVSELPPVFYKRLAFMHEREVRAVAAPPRRKDWDGQPDDQPDGVEYPVNPSSLIEEIVVSPYSPEWLAEVVEGAVASLGVKARVRESSLKRRPLSEMAYATVRGPEAYFAFMSGDAAVPLRIWARSRAQAEQVAREHWGLDSSSAEFVVWKQAECEAGHAEQPSEYVRVSNCVENGMKALDPERDLY
ncbi:MAG: hypothetical protein F4Y86_06330 [Gammaproteobacteria bacterium]|nr:hypothetical protein [Gammaproteobacteria bacterium]